MTKNPDSVPAAAEPGSVIAKIAPLAIVTIVAALGTSLVNVVLPLIVADYNTDMSTVQWATLAFLLASTVLIVPAGWLGDRLGKSRVLLVGISVFLIGSLLGALAPSLGLIVAGRAVQGIGAAAMLSLPVAVVRQTVRPEQIGQAMGTLGSSMAAGMAMGPAVGGLLGSTALGWRGAFLFFLPLTLLAMFLVWKFLPTSEAEHTRRPLDLAGLVVLALLLGSYAIAVTLTPGGWLGTAGLLMLAAVLTVVFIQIEKRAAAPLVNFRMLAKLQIMPQLGMTFAGAFVMMTFTIIPPFYLTLALGLETGWMGLVMAVGPVMAILSGVPAGILVDRLGAPRMTVLGLSAMTLAGVAFVTLPPMWGLIGFLLAAVLLTPGNQMFMAGNNTSVMSRAGKLEQGSVSGLLNLSRYLGFITATALLSFLFDLATASQAGAAGVTLGMQIAFGLAAVFGLIGVVLSRSAFKRPVSSN